MQRPKTLRDQIEERIARRRSEDVFLTREFRALRALVRDQRLVRLGYGVYGRAVVSRISGRQSCTAATDSPEPRAKPSPSSV